MNPQKLDFAILSRVQSLNKNQKSEVLDYIENIPKKPATVLVFTGEGL